MQSVFKIWSKIVLALSTGSLLVACGAHSIKVRDTTAWGDKGRFGATGVHTLCSIEKCPPVLLDKNAWDEKRIGMVCVDGSYFADMQANIDKLCTRQPKTCDYEEVRMGREALRRVNRMLKVAAEHPELREYDFLRSMQFLEDYNE